MRTSLTRRVTRLRILKIKLKDYVKAQTPWQETMKFIESKLKIWNVKILNSVKKLKKMFLRFINYKMKIVLIGEFSPKNDFLYDYIFLTPFTHIFSERIDYERSIENQMEMINQQNHEIESLRGMSHTVWLTNLTQIWPDFDLKMIPIRPFSFFFRGLTFQRWKHKPPTTCKRGIDWTPTHNATKCWKCS